MSKPEEEKNFFVSRRGHQVGINQVDLGDIDIESEQTSPGTPKSKIDVKDSPKATVKVTRPAPRLGSRMKRVLIVVIILVVALPVVIGEVVAAQYRSGVVNARQDLSQFVTKSVLPLQKKSAVTADQLRSTAIQVNDIATKMCRGGLIDNIATLYPRASTTHGECKAAQTKYAALASGLYELEAQARYLEKVGALMKTVTTPITDEYAVIGAQHTAWLSAAEQLKKLSPPTSMGAAHKELSSRVSAVTEQWSKLNVANNAQNGSAFLEAEKALAVEYEAVRTASVGFADALAITQAKVTDSYNALK